MFRVASGRLFVVVVLTILTFCAGRAGACTVSITATVSGSKVTLEATLAGNECHSPSLSIYLDGRAVNSRQCPDPSTNCSLTEQVSMLCRPGTHTAVAQGVCAMGNDCHEVVSYASTTFMIDETPHVSITSIGPDDTGDTRFPVTYEFRNTEGGPKWLYFFVNDRVVDAPQVGDSGTYEFFYDFACKPTGTYEAKVVACPCVQDLSPGRPLATATTNVGVQAEPEVSLRYSAADGQFVIPYRFGNTNSMNDRLLRLFIDDRAVDGYLAPDIAGTITRRADACWKTARAEALACQAYWDTDEIQSTAQPPDVEVSAAHLGFEGTQPRFEGTVHWDMGQSTTSWHVDVRVLDWIDAQGVTHPGYTVFAANPPAQRERTEVFTFLAPTGAQQVHLLATASNCIGTRTDTAAVECPSCPLPGGGGDHPGASANPVYFADGNMRLTDTDPLPPVGGNALTRTYNSHEQESALFGRGWTTELDRRLVINANPSGDLVWIETATNETVAFQSAAGGYVQVWPTSGRALGSLSHDAAAGTFTYRAGGSLRDDVFRSADGRLIAMRDLATTREARIAYDTNGIVQSVTDSWSGTAWEFSVDIATRRVASIGMTGRPDLVWTYAYDAAGNLRSVIAPGNAVWRTYEYADNRLTASRDALGNLLESHAYDARGRAVSSTGDVDEIALIDYDVATSVPGERITRVTQKTGATTDYVFRRSGGSYRPARVIGGCASCGARDAAFVYDSRGRVVRRQDADGYVTVWTYDEKQLVSEQLHMKPAGCDPASAADRCRMAPDALAAAALDATASSMTTTYLYSDALWPDRVTAALTPSLVAPGRERRETAGYHATLGVARTAATVGWVAGEEDFVPLERSVTTAFYGDALAPGGSDEDRDPGGSPPDPYAPAFNPGGSFSSAWLSLPQPPLRKSIDGPRTDANDVTTFVYYPIDASVPASLRGRLAATRNAAGHTTHYEAYDIFGNVTRVVDPNGTVTASAHDTLGRLVTVTINGVTGCDTERDPLCATDLVTMRTYAGAGPLQSERRPGGGATVYTYDERGRVASISRGPSETDLRERMEWTYDAATGKKDLERTLAFESGAWVEKKRESYAYDSLGQLETVTHADGTSIGYAYDAEGKVTSVRDENHLEPNTTYDYDAAGRLQKVEQTLGSSTVTTRYAYDRYGNLITVTDPNGNVTQYAYDDFGQMVRQQSPVTRTTTYDYDVAGELVQSTDANGAVTARTYDALGRVTSALSTRGAAQESISWAYDENVPFAIGRLTSMQDPAGATTYAYERRGLLASETKTIGGAAYATAYQYDADGNRSRIAYPSGHAVAFTFDYAARPYTATAGSTPLVLAASYLPFGPLSETVLGNGTTKRMTYDTRYRPLTNELTGPSEPIASYAYEYDATGNITAIADQLDPESDRIYGYDDLNRLRIANTGARLWGQGSYTYDAMGNLTAFVLGEWKQESLAYRQTTPLLQSVNGMVGTRVVDYDAAGNETVFGETTYAYSPRNALAAHEGLTHTYDGRGLRTISTRPVTIAAFDVTAAVVGGTEAQGTVTLSSAAPAGGAQVILQSSNAAASVPEFVSIAEGSVSGSFAVTTQPVSGEVQLALTASFNGSSRTTTLTVTGSRIDEIALQPSSVVGGGESMGTIALASPAPEAGLSIAVASDDEHARVPARVIVAGGETSAVFTIGTTPVSAARDVAISASAAEEEITKRVTLTILPPSVAAVAFETPLYGGIEALGTLSLDGPAPEGGMVVWLESSSALLTLPANVIVSAGSRSVSFAATARPVEVQTAVRVTAGAQSVLVQIEPPLLAELSVSPSIVVGGETATAVTTIHAPAAAEGASVSMTTSDATLIPSPGRVIIDGGTSSTTTPLPTSPVTAPTPVVVSAERNGIVRSATVTLAPPPVTLQSFALAMSTVVGTNDVTGTVTLTDAAPAGGLEIDVASSDATVAVVPPVVLVPAGAQVATFTIETRLVSAATDVAITAVHAATEKTASLTVLPPDGNYIVSLTLDPAFIVTGATMSVTLAQPATGNGIDVSLSSDAPAVLSVPASIRIHPNATAATLTLSAGVVTMPTEVVIAATYGGVIQRARVIVAPQNAVTIASLTITPDRVPTGATATGIVTLTAPAPFGGAAVTLNAKRRNIVTMPPTVTVPEGATTTTFAIATEPVHGRAKSAEITASYNGVTVAATLTVTPTATAVARCASLALPPCLVATALDTTIEERRYTLYTPELSLLAETAASTAASAPPIAYEYVWFGGQPLAQITSSTGEIAWYFNDHLGTPILQTDASSRVIWRAEYDPYGTIYSMRRGESRHQPLRFPGQTAEDGTDLYQNVFRWYRAGVGRYTQADPMGKDGDPHPYLYAAANPITTADRYGLLAEVVCARIGIGPLSWTPFRHCRIRVTCDKCEGGNFDGPYDTSVGLERNRRSPRRELRVSIEPVGAEYTYRYPINNVDQNDSCQFGRCVQAVASTYADDADRWTPQYRLWGPNSNSFAGHIMRWCGGVGPPDGPFGATGFNQPLGFE